MSTYRPRRRGVAAIVHGHAYDPEREEPLRLQRIDELPFILAIALWALPRLAAAQDVPTQAPSPIGPAPVAAEAADTRWIEARAVVARGEALFQRGNYEAALVDFERAYRSLDGHPRQHVVLYNLALCYERMFRYDEAVPLYEQYLIEGGPGAEDHELVRGKLSALRALLAEVDVRANVPAELWIDDRRVGESPAKVLVPAGRHVLEVRARLHESAQRELWAEPRGVYRLDFELQPLSNYRGLSPGYFFASLGATAAVTVTAAVLGAQTLAKRSEGLALARDSMQLRTPELERAEEEVRDWAFGTDLAIGGAILFGATTVLLAFLTDWEAGERATP